MSPQATARVGILLGAFAFWTDELYHVVAARSLLETGTPYVPGYTGGVYTRALPITWLAAAQPGCWMTERGRAWLALVPGIGREAQPRRGHRGLDAVRDAQLVEDVRHVHAGRLAGYEQALRDLAIRTARSDEAQDLDLAS